MSYAKLVLDIAPITERYARSSESRNKSCDIRKRHFKRRIMRINKNFIIIRDKF